MSVVQDRTTEAATSVVPRTRSMAPRVWSRRGGLTAIIFALPALIVFGYFSWGPIVRGLIMSWQRINFAAEPSWVGWSNFAYVLSDPLLPQAVGNTLLFVALGLVIGFPVPLFLAVFMAELRKSKRLFNLLAYLPVVIPPVVAILLWKTFYDPGATGLFNQILGFFGIAPLGWLNSPALALPSMVIEATWAGAGATVIIYIAALTGVRSELYEAADLDGAGIWSKIWNVTLPQIRGVIIIMVLLQLIGTMQVFAEPFLFTGGGPSNSTMTVLLMIYNYAFVSQDFGAASALSTLLALALGVLSLAYFAATKKWSTE